MGWGWWTIRIQTEAFIVEQLILQALTAIHYHRNRTTPGESHAAVWVGEGHELGGFRIIQAHREGVAARWQIRGNWQIAWYGHGPLGGPAIGWCKTIVEEAVLLGAYPPIGTDE